MNVEIKSVEVIVNPELNAAQITITPTFSSGVPDVNKQYVDEGLYLKVDKVDDHSLVHDTEIDKLAEYPEFEDLEFSHENLTDKNSEAAFQHVDTTVTKETLAEADKVPIYDSVTGKVVLTPKSNLIDESFKKLAVRRGASFNETTGFYELNGLTDITEAQMMDIYNYTSQSVFQYVQDEMLVASPIRTTYNRPLNGAMGGTSMKYTYLQSNIEVYKCSLVISTAMSCFQNCLSLKIVDYIHIGSIANPVLLNNMFNNCAALVTCNLRYLKVNLSLQWSPLLSLASLQYIIQYRANGTTQITITVHPTVFAKLTDNVNYPTWYAVAQDALTKFITFATV